MANVAPASVTITSTIGPGLAVTSAVFLDVTDIEYDFAHNVIRITYGTPSKIGIFDYSAIATVTHTISGGATTIVIST